MKKQKKTNWQRAAIAAIIILVLEVFVWNHSFWLTSEYNPIRVDKIYTETGQLLETGTDYQIGDNSYLEIRDIDQKVKNIYLNVETYKETERNVLTLRLNMIDEGNQEYYGVDNRVISSLLDKCNYISVYPYGNLKSLKITFPREKGTTITIKTIILNQPAPLFFSVERVMVMYLLYLLIQTLFFQPYETHYQQNAKKRRLITFAIFLICIVLIVPLTLIGNDRSGLATMDKYTELTHSLANGMVSVVENADERLLAAENPYDKSERTALGVGGYKWDYAYFNGKIYVYFGVIPVILTYLPYYLLTGSDLPHIVPYLIFLIGLIAGAFKLTDALVCKYCQKIPLKLYYLLQITFMLGIGTLIFAKRVCIYNMAIVAGLTFTVWGLYLWISSLSDASFPKMWKVAAGSLCMALVAGCRPQLLIASFLALPIFAGQGKKIFRELKAKENVSKHLLVLILFCLPYIITAVFLMWYNAARFGSPFDFGSAYNLTTNDMTKRGFHIARWVSGLWYYLFQPPSVNIEFPYIGTTSFHTAYQGKTIYESGIGGIFATNLILLPCLLFYKYRAKFREKKVYLFICFNLIGAILIVCADVQMGGLLTRYTADFTLMFYLAAYMILFTFIDEYYSQSNTLICSIPQTVWCRTLALLCCITCLYLILSVFSLYVSGDYDAYRPVWYYHMKELWGLFDV